MKANRLSWALLLAAVLLAFCGCKQTVHYPSAPKPAEEVPQGPRYVRHLWKADDDLNFLAVYYADRPDAASQIEAACTGDPLKSIVSVIGAVSVP